MSNFLRECQWYRSLDQVKWATDPQRTYTALCGKRNSVRAICQTTLSLCKMISKNQMNERKNPKTFSQFFRHCFEWNVFLFYHFFLKQMWRKVNRKIKENKKIYKFQAHKSPQTFVLFYRFLTFTAKKKKRVSWMYIWVWMHISG